MRYGRPHFGVSSGLSGLTVCVAVSSLLVALSSCAQEIASPSRHSANDLAFRCFVADSTGHPLSGIPVELRSSVPPLDEIQALTEADGSYTFGGLRSGDYLLTVAGGLLLPPSHVFVKSTPPRAMTVRLPIALAGSHGHGTGVVSVKQLNVPAKVQESSQGAYRPW